MAEESLGPAYFDALYARDEDPWLFATSDYEREKYRRSREALMGRRYGKALEIGCSIGVYTRELAGMCDALLCVDISAAALERAKRRCADLAHVGFVQATVPRDFPDGRFDLIVLSEVGYYWNDADLTASRDRIAHGLAPDGLLELVHFLPKVADYLRDGDAVHEAFLGDSRFVPVRGWREERYRLDVLRAAPA